MVEDGVETAFDILDAAFSVVLMLVIWLACFLVNVVMPEDVGHLMAKGNFCVIRKQGVRGPMLGDEVHQGTGKLSFNGHGVDFSDVTCFTHIKLHHGGAPMATDTILSLIHI